MAWHLFTLAGGLLNFVNQRTLGSAKVGGKNRQVGTVYIPIFIKVPFTISAAIRSAKVRSKHCQVCPVYIVVSTRVNRCT